MPDDPEGNLGPKEDKKPSLPEQASGTAKEVLGTVFGGIADSVSSIGGALSGLLAGNDGEQS